MNEKIKAMLGHVFLAALYFLGYNLESIHSEAILSYFLIFFGTVGLWAAIGTKRSHWFSLLFAFFIWFIIGVVIIYNVTSHDLAQTDRHLRSEGGSFYLILAYLFIGMVIGAGFGVGRIGLAVLRFFQSAKSREETEPTSPIQQ